MLYVMLLAGEFVLPYYPTFRGETFDIQTANAWEFISAYRDGRLNLTKSRHLGTSKATTLICHKPPFWTRRYPIFPDK